MMQVSGMMNTRIFTKLAISRLMTIYRIIRFLVLHYPNDLAITEEVSTGIRFHEKEINMLEYVLRQVNQHSQRLTRR